MRDFHDIQQVNISCGVGATIRVAEKHAALVAASFSAANHARTGTEQWGRRKIQIRGSRPRRVREVCVNATGRKSWVILRHVRAYLEVARERVLRPQRQREVPLCTARGAGGDGGAWPNALPNGYAHVL